MYAAQSEIGFPTKLILQPFGLTSVLRQYGSKASQIGVEQACFKNRLDSSREKK